eukprot:384540-Hanusia_phi.AAC.1
MDGGEIYQRRPQPPKKVEMKIEKQPEQIDPLNQDCVPACARNLARAEDILKERRRMIKESLHGLKVTSKKSKRE